MAEEENASVAAEQEQPQQQFAMQRIYTKDVSFESPNTPTLFQKQWQPKMNVEMKTASSAIDDKGNYEVVLTLTVTAKIEEDTAFLVEVQQAGIFFITGFEKEALGRILGTTAPNVLFPYARENIDSLAVKGGFPAVMLAPVNFDQLYHQALQQQAQKAEQAAEATAH